MEPEREDGTATVITHRLAPVVFYFDNPTSAPVSAPPCHSPGAWRAAGARAR